MKVSAPVAFVTRRRSLIAVALSGDR